MVHSTVSKSKIRMLEADRCPSPPQPFPPSHYSSPTLKIQRPPNPHHSIATIVHNILSPPTTPTQLGFGFGHDVSRLPTTLLKERQGKGHDETRRQHGPLANLNHSFFCAANEEYAGSPVRGVHE